jgi:hypothetical protein
MSERPPARAVLFWGSAAAALALHALLLFGDGGLHGGADLKPHLRLIQLMGEQPALRSVYAPAYHALGALLAPWIGLAVFPKLFALASAAGLIAGFRLFQRAARLPDAAAALFAWAPYTFALSWCLPKVEAAGYAICFAALGLLLKRRYLAVALLLAAAFLVHTAAALFLGLCGGALALARRDHRALLALAAGSLGAAPLLAAHLAAGCTPAQALLFSPGDYLRTAPQASNLASWDRLLALANPIAVAIAVLGARELWQRWRPVAILSCTIAILYSNELWLAPFGARTTLDLLRGLTILAFPVAVSAGVMLAGRPRATAAVVIASALWAIGTAYIAVPRSCHVRPIDFSEIQTLSVDRCSFRWRTTRQEAPRGGREIEPSAPHAN